MQAGIKVKKRGCVAYFGDIPEDCDIFCNNEEFLLKIIRELTPTNKVRYLRRAISTKEMKFSLGTKNIKEFCFENKIELTYFYRVLRLEARARDNLIDLITNIIGEEV